MTATIFATLIRSRLGQWFFGRVMLSLGILWTLGLVSSTFLEPNKITILDSVFLIFGFLILTSIWTYNLFQIGNFIMKKTLLALLFFSVAIFVMAKLHVPHSLYQEAITLWSLGISFSLGFIKLFSLKRRFFILKNLSDVDKMGNGDTYEKGRQFEEYIASLYQQMGFNAVTTTTMRKEGRLPQSIQKRGGSGEQGVDVFLYDHITKENVIVQCKHYSSKVSNSAIQEIVAAKPLYNATRGIVITNNYFTEPAKELALSNNIILIDRTELGKFIEHVGDLKKNKAS